MFRIKTDIRQFKCDSEEKVEDLIRKWVIRPTDLIRETDAQDWSVIGEHPTFQAVFTHLADHVRAQDAAPAANGAAALATVSAAAAPAQILKKAPLPIPMAPAGVEPPSPPDEVTIMTERTADLLGLDDEALPAPLAPPVAPEGVEPPAPQDEPTQIFAREEDDAAAGGAPQASSPSPDEPQAQQEEEEEEEAPALTRKDLPEELFLTNELSSPFIDRASLIDDLGAQVDAQLKPAAASLDVDLGWDSLGDDLRSTDELSTHGQDDLRQTQEFDAARKPSDKIIVDLGYSSDARSREEVTQMTPVSQVVQEDRARANLPPFAPLDDSESPPLDSLDEPLPLPLPRSALKELLTTQEGDVLSSAPSLPKPPKLVAAPSLAPPPSASADPAPSSSSSSPPAALAKAEGAAPALDARPTTPDSSGHKAAPDASVQDASAQDASAQDVSAQDASTQDVSAQDAPQDVIPVDPYTALSEASDPFEDEDEDEDGAAGDDEDDEDDEDPQARVYESPKPKRRAVVQDRDLISMGYAMELPFPVKPSASDAAYGVVPSSWTEAQKDARFPRPRPKKIGELHMRSYGQETPTRDLSRFMVVALLLIFVLVVGTAIALYR